MNVTEIASEAAAEGTRHFKTARQSLERAQSAYVKRRPRVHRAALEQLLESAFLMGAMYGVQSSVRAEDRTSYADQ